MTTMASSCAYILSILSIIVSLFTNHVAAQNNTYCISSIQELALKESLVADTSVLRMYTMCTALYAIGTLDFYNNLRPDGQPMIPIRPNLHLKCGDSGRRENQCLITEGDIFLDGTSNHGIVTDSVDNVVIEGFTFIGAGRYAAEFTKPGKVLFRDCVFKDQVNATASVFANYFSSSNTNDELSITFQRCDFVDNTYKQNGGQASVVVGNGLQNRLIFNECRFSNNDMLFNNTFYDKNSYLIETQGTLEMVNNCFENNKVGVAAVGVYNSFLSAGNYGLLSGGTECQFAAKFADQLAYQLWNPECVTFDVTDECGISSTYSPIGAPTMEPSNVPSYSPTITAQPTLKPIPMPTRKPIKSLPKANYTAVSDRSSATLQMWNNKNGCLQMISVIVVAALVGFAL